MDIIMDDILLVLGFLVLFVVLLILTCFILMLNQDSEGAAEIVGGGLFRYAYNSFNFKFILSILIICGVLVLAKGLDTIKQQGETIKEYEKRAALHDAKEAVNAYGIPDEHMGWYMDAMVQQYNSIRKELDSLREVTKK